DDRSLGLETGRAQGGQGVEDVERVRPVGSLRLDGPGPGGAPLGQLRGDRGRPGRKSHRSLYHAISVMAVLRPEPTPMHRMRSPGWRLAASRDRVMGREAGPTLPSSGSPTGIRSGSRFAALVIEFVCTSETWCMT